MTNFRNDYSNIPNDMHGLIVKIYISQSTSINKFIHKIFLLYEWTGKMLICLEDKCTRLIIRHRKLQLSNLIISLNLNLATKLTVCTAKHVRRSFDFVLMSLDAPLLIDVGSFTNSHLWQKMWQKIVSLSKLRSLKSVNWCVSSIYYM